MIPTGMGRIWVKGLNLEAIAGQPVEPSDLKTAPHMLFSELCLQKNVLSVAPSLAIIYMLTPVHIAMRC